MGRECLKFRAQGGPSPGKRTLSQRVLLWGSAVLFTSGLSVRCEAGEVASMGFKVKLGAKVEQKNEISSNCQKNCCIFALAVCEMHIGVNSNIFLIRLVCDRWGGFFQRPSNLFLSASDEAERSESNL